MSKFATEINDFNRLSDRIGGGRGGQWNGGGRFGQGQQGSWNSGGRGGGRFGQGGGGGGGRPVRMPGKANIVDFKLPRMPRMPRMPEKFFDKLPRPRFPQIPRMPHKFNLPNGIIPSFGNKGEATKFPSKDKKKENSNSSDFQNKLNDYDKGDPVEEIFKETDGQKANDKARNLNLGRPNNDINFGLPGGLYQINIKFSVSSRMKKWYLSGSSPPEISNHPASFFSNSPGGEALTGMLIIRNPTSAFVQSFVSPAEGSSTRWAAQVKCYWKIKDSQGLNYIMRVGSFSDWNQISTGQINGVFSIYQSSVIPVLEFIRLDASPSPWRNEYKEEEMPCEKCQAAQVIRSLQVNITHQQVNLIKMPNGDLLARETMGTKRIFALPGTEYAVKEQFNIISEIKKRTAHAFNQARRSKVLARLLQVMNVIGFLVDIHNAMMLSKDLGVTFFNLIAGTVDNVVNTVADLPFLKGFMEPGEQFSTATVLKNALEGAAKKVFGVKKWDEIKGTIIAANRIVSAASTILETSKTIATETAMLAELAAENSGKLGNRLRQAGILPDEGQWFAENYSHRTKAYDRVMRLNGRLEGVVNAAMFLEQMSSHVLNIKNNIKALDDQQKELEKSFENLESKVRKDNKDVSKKDAIQEKASQGKEPTGKDLKEIENA